MWLDEASPRERRSLIFFVYLYTGFHLNVGIMKKMFLSFAVLLAIAVTASADENKIYSLEINYLLHKDGSAVVTEVWDIDVAEGTEWYLVRNNMRDMELSGFKVHDEKGMPYAYENSWDIDRNIEEKAGRYGIVGTGSGMELCWGLGSHERHRYTVEYTLSNAVQSLEDYDMFHFQVVNKKLSSAPERVRTIVEMNEFQMDTTNTRLWGFGYEGTARIYGGKAFFESSEPFVTESSMICLLRLDKGWFENASPLDETFDEHLEMAMDGSDFEDGETNLLACFTFLAGVVAAVILLLVSGIRSTRRRILGINYDEVKESMDIPFDGNLYIANKVLNELMESRRGNSVAAALILRMIFCNALKIKTGEKSVDLIFNPDFDGSLDNVARELYAMMKEAAGEDGILQEKEFAKWSRKHAKRVGRWGLSIDKAAKKLIDDKGYMLDKRYNAEFQREACKLLGLKKFLDRFVKNGSVPEGDPELWKELLVYAALFEVSDAFIKKINALDPGIFMAATPYNYNTWYLFTRQNTGLSRSIINTAAMSGTGGTSSFGGGAGFSGGGIGGGAR